MRAAPVHGGWLVASGLRTCIALAALMLAISPLASAQTIAIVGGRVFPVSGPVVENATVVLTDGKIVAVGSNVAVPANATRIDARGKWVTPGLVNADTQLGLVEVQLEPSTNDEEARGQDAVSAAFRVWEGLNPATVLWAPARNEGVTTVLVVPSGGLLAGQVAAIDLADGTKAQLIRRAPAAMAAQLDSPSAANTRARGELVMRLRELLDDARVYATRKEAYEGGQARTFSTGRLHLDALVPVIHGELPLMVTVNRAADIETALDVASEFKVRLVVRGGAEAWQVAERLASANVPVLTTALDNIPSSFTTLGSRQENAALLRRAGVSVSITAGAAEAFNVRNIRQHAGNAVAYGLPWDEALRAVTLAPSEAFNLQGEIGSLQPGRDANVVVWSGDPFEFTTRAEHVYIKGREVSGASRQDMLTDRYRRRQP